MWNLFFSSFKFRIHHLKKKSHVWSLLSATALQEALLRAVKMPKKEREEGKPPQRSTDMISTLTDGMPNRGELPQFGRLVRIKCCVMFYWAPVPEVFMTVCVCVCVWGSVSFLSWLQKGFGLLVLGRDEQTKQRVGPQNIFEFWC